MAVEAALPAIGTVLFTAAIDSINPCAIGVLILLISTMVANSKRRGRMLVLGFAYVFAVFITYLVAGLGLITFLTAIPLVVTQYISIIVGVLIAGMGIVEIKEYFWYGRGFSLAISPKMAKAIHKRLQNISVAGVMLLGAFVSAVELPCTGGPYLAITLMLAQNFNLMAFALLVVYNIIFVLPLIVILLLVAGGMKITTIKKWKHANRSYMRLATGILLVFLSWLLILMANGSINLG
ncbi:MAG: GAP family protein [Candidatus Aenigmarchaeota archaeon]|nr:GAP family protein [Candidatus Aenigmarchaeota archaeon]